MPAGIRLRAIGAGGGRRGSPMTSGFQIEHQCPQCGAPVLLEETDRLIRCGYCRVSSFLTAPRMFRYVLPHRVIDRDLVYFPYYRFRGTLFMCAKGGVDFRLIDASMPAQTTSYFPPSVGVRAQTQKLRFAVSGIPGKFLPMTLPSGVVPETVHKRYGPAKSNGILHQEFVGDTMSVIYAPFYIYGKLFDGITERAVSRMLPETFEEQLEGAESSSWGVRFLATVCPGCGWDLHGERDSLVLMCRNCNTAWQAAATALESLPVAHLPSTEGVGLHLPFWQISADIQGLELKHDRDLIRVANLAKVLPEDAPSRPVRFWTPAFKVRPKVFLRLARTLTLTQAYAPAKEGLPSGNTYPVTLRAAEGVDTVKIVIASFLKPVDQLPKLLPGVRIRAKESRLVYLPFTEGHHEWKNADLHLSIPKAVLRHAIHL